MPSILWRFAIVAVLAVIPLMSAGGAAGGAQASGYTELVKAVNEVDSARSVHMAFAISKGTTSLALNLVMFRKSGDAVGTVYLNGIPSRLIIVGPTAYERINPQILEQLLGVPDAQAESIGSEWISGPNGKTLGTGANSQFGVGTTFQYSLIHQLLFPAIAIVAYRTMAITRIDGRRAYRLDTGEMDETIWLDATGSGYPLQVEVGGGNGELSLRLSGWNHGALPRPPSGAVPLSSLHIGQVA